MRIEISAGGLSAGIAVAKYQADMARFDSDTEGIISGFKTVYQKACNLSGGIGTLRDAVGELSERIQEEEARKEAASTVRKKTNDFLELTIRVDKQVASLVNKNKDEFYQMNPWLKPAVVAEDAPWYEKAWDWLCDKGEKIVDDVKGALTWVADTTKKAWNGLVEFYNEHKKAVATILMIAGAITALIVLSLIPGGGILATIIAGAAWGTISGAVIGGIAGGLGSVAAGGSFWEGAENGAFSGAIGGAISGAAFAGIGAAGQALGKAISCLSTVGKSIQAISKISSVAALAMNGFDVLALVDRVIDPDSNYIAELNAKAHSNIGYNLAQTGVNAVAVFTGGMTQTMTCFVEGTLVLTAAGMCAIEKIKVGDIVISTNPETMETSEKRVLETYVLKNSRLVHLHIDGETIITTENHPFYVCGRGFINAGELRAGFGLLKMDGSTSYIEKCEAEQLAEPSTVYNFQVEDFHTYYVGNSCVLVHNANCRLISNGDGSYDAELSYKEDWTPEQRLEADKKCKYLSDADTIKTDVTGVRDASKTSRFRADNSILGYQDVDHIQDLQLNGKDIPSNMWGLDASVNRSLGKQINILLKDLKIGTKIRNFKMV